MSSHAEHGGGGDLTAIELARERVVPLANIVADIPTLAISGLLGWIFMFLKPIYPVISQSGKMESGHGGH